MSVAPWVRHRRKRQRRRVARNVRAFRARQSAQGMRRLDVTLTAAEYARLLEALAPGETYSRAIGRLISAN